LPKGNKYSVETEQQLNAKIDAAIAEYRNNPKELRHLTRCLRHPDTRDACRRCANALLKREPNSIRAITSLIYAYSDGSGKIRTALDLAHQRSKGNPEKLKIILDKASKYLDSEELKKFNALIQNYNNKSAELIRRQQINSQANSRLLERNDIKINTCDVITVASNEGPYIAEFIHHYLYQGFHNLFIGLNNDTSGQTGPIIAAIAKHYPQIHLIHTDQEHQQGRQRGSYCKLYEEASKTTKASHCMVVDVDEYWVAYPFSTNINQFLAAQQETEADVISSNWLHCHRSNLFDNPLDLTNTRLELTKKFKSLFRYGIAVSDLGAHVPYTLAKSKTRHTTSDRQAVPSQVVTGVRKLRKSGIQACIHTANTGWVIHRHTRSELEYAAKLLHPDVNELENPFKANRSGYLLREESSESRQLATNLFGASHQPPQAYLNSLEAFIDHCGIRHLITTARAQIDEETINKQIQSMNPDQIIRRRMIWQRTFQGTRFLERLEQRCLESNAEKVS